MPNTTSSPYMGIPVPTVGVDPGPDWANNLNSGLGIIDSHDHSTGKGAPITGPIIGSAITNATIDNSVIGGTTPAAASFTKATIGASGSAFTMKTFTGTNPLSTITQLVAAPTAFFGAIGTTSVGGGTTSLVALGTGSGAGFSWNFLYIDSSGNINVRNYDGSNANTYNITLFYIP